MPTQFATLTFTIRRFESLLFFKIFLILSEEQRECLETFLPLVKRLLNLETIQVPYLECIRKCATIATLVVAVKQSLSEFDAQLRM